MVAMLMWRSNSIAIFLLHKTEQAYCRVELPGDLVEELKLEKTLEGSPLEVQRFMQFGCLVFGWQSSPYFALCMHARCIELVKRDPKDPTSAFCYERVELILPYGTGNGGLQPSFAAGLRHVA